MSSLGYMGLLIALVGAVLSVVFLTGGHLMGKRAAATPAEREGEVSFGIAETLNKGGRILSLAVFLALTLCCGILVYCFMVGDTSLAYVGQNRSDASGSLGWLYHLSGLWAGRGGTLLFWA